MGKSTRKTRRDILKLFKKKKKTEEFSSSVPRPLTSFYTLADLCVWGFGVLGKTEAPFLMAVRDEL